MRLRRPRGRQRAAAVVAVFVIAGSTAIGAQIIDRVLAVVGGEPITLSDVTAAARFGLIPEPSGTDDRTQAALNSLIERQLQLIEVNRYVPPEPPAAEVDAKVAEIGARFATAAAFDAALVETGLTAAQLRTRVRDTLRIDAYLHQRFGAAYQPGEADLLRYYRAHESDFTQAGGVRPFDAVRDQVRQRLVEERTESLVRDWIAGLRRRGDVTILPK
jgi:hypothetical protein